MFCLYSNGYVYVWYICMLVWYLFACFDCLSAIVHTHLFVLFSVPSSCVCLCVCACLDLYAWSRIVSVVLFLLVSNSSHVTHGHFIFQQHTHNVNWRSLLPPNPLTSQQPVAMLRVLVWCVRQADQPKSRVCLFVFPEYGVFKSSTVDLFLIVFVCLFVVLPTRSL